MRTVDRRPGLFAILVPSPGFIILEAYLVWQALVAYRAMRESGASAMPGGASTVRELLLWSGLTVAVALFALMMRLGDRVESRRVYAPRRRGR